MNFPDSIEVQFKPRDFKGNTYFGNNYDCPLARAVKRTLKVNYVYVGHNDVTIYSDTINSIRIKLAEYESLSVYDWGIEQYEELVENVKKKKKLNFSLKLFKRNLVN